MVEEPVQGAIDEDGTEVDRDVQRLLGRGQIRSGGAAERPYEITTRSSDGREWTVRPPFGRDISTAAALSSTTMRSAGGRARSPQSAPFSTLMVSAPNRKGPRRRDGWHRRRGGRGGRGGIGGVRSELPEQVGELLDVAHEVAGGHLVVATEQHAERLPACPTVGHGANPGVG